MKICGEPMPRAKNGADRGSCTRPYGHGFNQHGSGTCTDCGVVLTTKNSKASVATKGSGKCRVCLTKWAQERRGMKPRNYQKPGSTHTFPCGCSGVLPERPEDANKFATRATGTGAFGCRAASIIYGSQASARRDGNKPIPLDTPHSVIRKLMNEPNCERCGEPLVWNFAPGKKAPHLHHNHDTGEIYGFTHPVCNPRALEREIARLRGQVAWGKKRSPVSSVNAPN